MTEKSKDKYGTFWCKRDCKNKIDRKNWNKFDRNKDR